MGSKVDLTDMTVQELEDLLESVGEERYRGRQIFRWVSKGIKDIDEMTDLSKDLRERLKSVAYIGRIEMLKKLVSKDDGTVKYLFKLSDGNAVESVLMEYKHGLTVCISSQVGCRMGCRFCASAHAGFARNLTAGEMINQVIFISKDAGRRIGNVVVMGIGEPFDNYDNLMKFLRIINSKEGINLGYRHITVSTCGLVPGILKFSTEGIPVNLSISLHAPNDAVRERLMPINKRYSIDKIVEACKIYTKTTGRRITFEYIMLDGVNDSRDNALELAHRIKDLLCHVNLIPANSIYGFDFKKSSREKMEAFRDLLERHGIETTIRRELGTDINAACGQLRRSSVSTG